MKPPGLSLFLLLCTLSPATASTPGEDAVRQMPMAHEALAARDASVKVHLVSARGYLDGKPGDAAGLTRLHAEVLACVQRNSERGIASKPPQAWPEHVISMRLDTYAAINRSIVYAAGLSYAVDPRDCSLMEARTSTASLSSSLGTCDVDLLAKTAHGHCDATGHARAAPPRHQPAMTAAQRAAIVRQAASSPAMAAFAAAMQAHPQAGTGERKTILGLECEIRPNPLDPEGKNCLARGGSFASLDAVGEAGMSGMTLEMSSPNGIQLRATQARLDTLVPNAVFAPYLDGGFRITRPGSRP